MISASFKLFVAAAIALSGVVEAKRAFTWGNLPHTWEDGQSGYNDCGTTDTPTAKCQTLIVNSVDDFCLWGGTKPNQGVGDSERDVVAWCTKAGHGGRIMPAGTIKGAHFVSTPNYIQLTGSADLSKININGNKDGGGELDPHGADGNGNPIGGLLFSTAVTPGSTVPQQVQEWHMFLEGNRFCLKACRPSDKNAPQDCPHVYDEQGCDFNDPGDYSAKFDTCDGDNQLPPGVYGSSTWFQGSPGPTPVAHPAGKKSNCVKQATITYGSYGSKVVTSAKPVTTTTKPSKSSSTKKPKPTKKKSKKAAPAATATALKPAQPAKQPAVHKHKHKKTATTKIHA